MAVEERPEAERTSGEVELRRVPVMVTAGWHGIGSSFDPVGADELHAAFSVSNYRICCCESEESPELSSPEAEQYYGMTRTELDKVEKREQKTIAKALGKLRSSKRLAAFISDDNGLPSQQEVPSAPSQCSPF